MSDDTPNLAIILGVLSLLATTVPYVLDATTAHQTLVLMMVVVLAIVTLQALEDWH